MVTLEQFWSLVRCCRCSAPRSSPAAISTTARQWVRIGIMVSASVFIGAGLVVFNLD